MKIEDLPLTGLIAYQQIVEMRTVHLMESWEDLQSEHKNGFISTSWTQKKLDEVRERIDKNEIVAAKMQKEVDKRVRKVFGGEVSPSSFIDKLRKQLIKEKEEFKNLISKRKVDGDKILKDRQDKPVHKLDTSVSSEKKV